MRDRDESYDCKTLIHQKYLLNYVKSTRNQIVFTMHRIDLEQQNGQCPFAVPNQSEDCKYNLISV